MDLFAAGIILFIMVMGRPPFRSATVKDEFYKMLVGTDPDKYWEIYSKGREPPSMEFKMLIQAMLSYFPEQRLSLAEIKGHPWMEGPIPSSEELKKECKARI